MHREPLRPVEQPGEAVELRRDLCAVVGIGDRGEGVGRQREGVARSGEIARLEPGAGDRLEGGGAIPFLEALAPGLDEVEAAPRVPESALLVPA